MLVSMQFTIDTIGTLHAATAHCTSSSCKYSTSFCRNKWAANFCRGRHSCTDACMQTHRTDDRLWMSTAACVCWGGGVDMPMLPHASMPGTAFRILFRTSFCVMIADLLSHMSFPYSSSADWLGLCDHARLFDWLALQTQPPCKQSPVDFLRFLSTKL